MDIPKDPFILLSYINTKLRDEYSDMDELCREMSLSKEEIISTLKKLDYEYDSRLNRFV